MDVLAKKKRRHQEPRLCGTSIPRRVFFFSELCLWLHDAAGPSTKFAKVHGIKHPWSKVPVDRPRIRGRMTNASSYIYAFLLNGHFNNVFASGNDLSGCSQERGQPSGKSTCWDDSGYRGCVFVFYMEHLR